MNVNRISSQGYYEKNNGAKAAAKSGGNAFYESLSENINEKAKTERKKEELPQPKNTAAAAAYPYRAAPSAERAYDSERVGADAALECEARQISYKESDYVKVYAGRGFCLMAQVDVDARSVYIEQKQEDGTLKGYEVNVDKLDKDTSDPVEQAVLAAWEKKTAETEDGQEELTVEEALKQFYEFIEDRIKNGPPKYVTGNSEFSIEEWDKLIESIDGQLDAIKEELEERIEKMKEKQMQEDISSELQSKRDGLQDTEDEKVEEELLMSLFQDMGKAAHLET